MVVTAGESHILVCKVNDDTKTMVESGALSNRVGNIYNDANSANIDEIAVAGGPKRGVDIWLVLVVVIAGRKSTKVVTFIIVPIVSISPVFVNVVDMV